VFGRRIELFRLFGFAVRADLSWFLIVALISWSLAASVFPPLYPDLQPATYWVMGVGAALGLFASVVLHELAHALVARRFQLTIRGITLFIFGGVAEMESEPPSPEAEFMVAIAGPLASVMVAAGCLGLGGLGTAAGWPAAITGVLVHLGWLNLLLVGFNLVPAFPLDGGRVLRSALWKLKSDLRWATRVTTGIGSGFGLVLVFLGVLRMVSAGDLVGGLWMLLIGLFLRNAAQIAYRQLMVRRTLEGEPVRRFMHTDPVVVSRALSVSELVDGYIYRHHHKLFPVVDNGRLLGCVSIRAVKELPREEWPRQSVSAIMESCTPDNTIGPDTDAVEALSRMSRTGQSRLMVVEEGRLLGIVTLKDLLGFLALKVELEGRAGESPAAGGRGT
jgi:Zn-dependent protease/predicted transcriptional regulator